MWCRILAGELVVLSMAVRSISSYVSQEFRRLQHSDIPRVFSGMVFENCHFLNCSLIQDEDVLYPIRVQDVTVSDGGLVNCNAIGVRFENVVLDNCQAVGDPMSPAGCVFGGVRLRGMLGSWIFNDMDPSLSDSVRTDFREAEREFYNEVDFALDISEGVFESADMYYLPGDLVVRDPETQVLIRKGSLAVADISQLPRRAVRILERVKNNPFDCTVLVVGRARKDFDEALEEVRMLVECGIAER